MASYKDDKKGTWFTSFYYTTWTGERKKKLKRGFASKKEALDWERKFLIQQTKSLEMSFADFVDVYENDMKPRLKLNTWETKRHIIRTKLMPYFENKQINQITASDIIQWQNTMSKSCENDGKPYSQTYLRTLHNQLSAIFNHAVRFYDLKSNPVAKVGSIGKKKSDEMKFWTKAEYVKFSQSMMNKPMSYYVFQILYWCGLRSGELLALTIDDFDFQKNTIRINKSYQRIRHEDIITDPKTPKSNRIIKMPAFLPDEIQDYIKTLYGYTSDQRIFQITKTYLHREMDRGCKEQGIDRIRIHDLRHSYVSLLIEMGFSAVAIADRVGHESIDITYNYAHLFPSKQIEIADKLDFEGRNL